MSAVLRAIVAAGHASKVNTSLTSLRDVARDLDLHPTANALEYKSRNATKLSKL